MNKFDMKYIFRRVLTFFIIFVLLSFIKSCEVHAETEIADLTIGGITFSNHYVSYLTPNNSISPRFDILTHLGSANALVLDICSNVNLSTNSNFKRYYNVGQSCPNSCYSNTIIRNNFGSECVNSDGYTGTSYRMIIPITKIDFGAGCGQSGCNGQVKDNLYFYNPYSYSVFIDINGAYVTDELSNTNDTNLINNVNTSINNLNQSINNQAYQQHQDSINTQNAINDAKNQAHQDAQQAHQDSQDLKNSLTDTSSPNNLNSLSNSAGWLPAGPVDSILNLPLSLLNNLSSNLSKNCQPVVLPIPLINSNLTLPCVKTLYHDMGIETFINWVGGIASAFILLAYLLKLYKWVDNTLTFRENNQIDNWGGL